MADARSNDAEPGTTTDSDVALTLRREQARVGAQWVAAGRVRVSRRVVTETRTVQVTVRREELVVETDAAAAAADGALMGTRLDGAAVNAPTGPSEPLVIVLREERPEVVSRVYPYERVVVHVDLAQSEQRIDSQVRTETVDYAVQPSI